MGKKFERYELEVTGFVVNQCIVDFAFTLQLLSDAQEAIVIRMEHPFTCTVEGHVMTFDPEGRPEQLGPALALLHKQAQTLYACKDGRLIVGFVDGSELVVPSTDSRYEAWTVNAPGDILLVSGPGPKLTIFEPDSS